MDNLNHAGGHLHHGGGASRRGQGRRICAHQTTPSGHGTSNSLNILPDHSVTVTVGGPMLHRSASEAFTSVSGRGLFSLGGSGQINLNASAIVGSSSNCCGSNALVMSPPSFDERSSRDHCCAAGHSTHDDDDDEDANFDGLDLGSDDHDPVPLGEILEKLQADSGLDDTDHETGGLGSSKESSKTPSEMGSLIRLHAVHDAVENEESPTISAMVNVATLDLSDPESIHQHLSQLNDTVLRVSANSLNSTAEDFFDTDSTTDCSQEGSNQASISISITASTGGAKNNNNNENNENDKAQDINNKESSSSNNLLTTYLKQSSLPQSPLTISPTSPITLPSSPLPPKTPLTPTTSPVTSRKSGSSGSSSSKASPQSCSVCSKLFSNASALAKHRLTHSEERRYHCNICGKAFKRQDHLNGHLLTHRSTKPFACLVDGCGKSYCDARSLRRHKENHHGASKGDKASDNQGDKATPSNGGSSTAAGSVQSGSTILSGPDHLFSKSSVLGDTKLKFSSKGLTAQQLQLIEQLFKESKAAKTAATASKSSSTVGTPVNSTQQTTPPLNATVKTKSEKPTPALPDKPVECTICSRKFKNIPALNGHMRLHGGYYKKDAEGRRLVGLANTSPLKTMTTSSSSTVQQQAKPAITCKQPVDNQVALKRKPGSSVDTIGMSDYDFNERFRDLQLKVA
jgi:uncharacterized Zn-finger protein